MGIITDLDELYNKRTTLKKVGGDGEKWEVYYLDEKTGEKWVEEYPNSKMHGGGFPILRQVEKFPSEKTIKISKPFKR